MKLQFVGYEYTSAPMPMQPIRLTQELINDAAVMRDLCVACGIPAAVFDGDANFASIGTDTLDGVRPDAIVDHLPPPATV